MAFYIILTFILFFASFWELFCKSSPQRSWMVLIGLSFLLWCFSWIRWEVGTDWNSYYEIYDECDIITWMEWGFLWLNRLVKYTVDNYSVLLALLGGILFYFQTKTLKELSVLPLTTLFIMWGAGFANVFFVRQALATSILLYSIILIEQRQLKGFLLCVGAATLIHAASIAFIPAYWVYRQRVSIRKFIVLLILACVGGTVVGNFVLTNLSNMLGGLYQSKVEGYTSMEAEELYNGMSSTEMYLRAMVGKLSIVLMAIALISRQYKEKARGMMNLFLFGILLLPVTYSLSPYLARICQPYFTVQVFLMAYIAASFSRLSSRVVVFSIFLMMTLFRLYLKLFVDYGGEAFLPFQTILF